MKTGAQHLHEMHAAAAAHHDAMAVTKKNQAGHFRAMLKEAAMGTDTKSPHAQMAAELDQEASLHESHAGYHRRAADKCEQAEKAAADRLNKLQPTNVSRINPQPAFRAIPRAGAPPLQATIDPLISKIAGLSDADMNSDEETIQ